MGSNWFLNTTWNEAIERGFNEKLRRARRKQQYLRIQASTLARSHPEIALELLDRYFALPDAFDQAQAHCDRAEALLALGRVNEAIDSYEAALAREIEFPHVGTLAGLDLAYLMATRGIRERYPRAIELLGNHKTRLLVPVEYFRWHAALALISADSHDAETAKAHARLALDAAALQHSGLRYHPKLGLVTERCDSLILKLELYAALSPDGAPDTSA